uniref:Uncharacterized protein n=1 Tax=Rhizophora mucronata TaxID=61149 RepID=A0A2P2J3V9_RHIMU
MRFVLPTPSETQTRVNSLLSLYPSLSNSMFTLDTPDSHTLLNQANTALIPYRNQSQPTFVMIFILFS